MENIVAVEFSGTDLYNGLRYRHLSGSYTDWVWLSDQSVIRNSQHSLAVDLISFLAVSDELDVYVLYSTIPKSSV